MEMNLNRFYVMTIDRNLGPFGNLSSRLLGSSGKFDNDQETSGFQNSRFIS